MPLDLLDPLARFVPMFLDGGEPTGGPPTPPAPQPPAPPAPRTYTEEDMKEVRGQAAAYRTQLRAAQGAVREFLGLAPEDALPDDLKTAIGAKVKGFNDAAEAAKTEAVKGVTEKLTKAERAFGLAEFKVKGAAAGIPADRLTAAEKLADWSTITVDLDAGTVGGVDEALEALKTGAAFLFQTTPTDPPKPPPRGGGPANPPTPPTKTIDEQVAEVESQMLTEADANKRSALSRQLSALKTQKMRGAK